MKKVLKSIFALVLVVVMVFSLTGCYGGGFLNQGQIDSLAKKLGLEKDGDGWKNPTADIEIVFEGDDSNNYKAVLRYELLFDKAPLTVNNFIALASEEFYDETLMDTANTSYSVWGRYKINDVSQYELQTNGKAIKGEFLSNNWSVDGSEKGDANATHELGCLGMYHISHSTAVNYWDTASTAFYVVWTNSYGSEDTITEHNYAVFAYIVESSFKLQSEADDTFYGKDDFRPGLDQRLVEFLANMDTQSRTDTDGYNLAATPVTPVRILTVKINGVSGEADTSLRLKSK